jgi:RNA polymerase sigma factor (sigma-70 family)
MDDGELLRDYVDNHSEAAFRMLVERHIPLVYGAALRQLDNRSLAEDVTQVVFIILARKAARLPAGTILSGWLYRTTRFTADKARRAEYRRHQREREALQMQTDATDPEWSRLAPVLDEAVARLGQADRTVILLRFFENKSLKDVGQALGLNEDTAQKRVSRAIIKLRGLLSKQGVPISAAVLTTAISTRAAPMVPTQVSAAVAAAGLGQGTVSPAIQQLTQATLRRLFWRRAVLAGLAGLTVLALGLILPVRLSAPHSTRNSPTPAASAAPAAADIRFDLQGTPGLGFDIVYAHDSVTQEVSGVLPAQVSFQADAFTASLTVRGPGRFGFEAYRDNLRIGFAGPALFTNATGAYFVESLPGGEGTRISVKIPKARGPN